ncbi:hypothetical protein GGX14DRAFT_406895 [Mycena pura]|uniref:Uncharacterized protein n=1 Tax=Mycena pura TaxID=153505 RepID=A0AAD6UWD7_9AGAR|nr:hypothetical protein GGX14DRAFT_406895 [Mycena pura]
MYPSQLVDLLLTESRRWKNLYLCVSPLHHKHFTTSKAGFPILEKLSLVAYEPLTKNTALFFESFQALVDLELRVDRRLPGTLDFIWARLPGVRVHLQQWRECENVHLTSVQTAMSDISLLVSDERAIDILLAVLVAPCLKRFQIEGQYSRQPITAFLDRSSFNCPTDELLLLLGSPHARDIIELDISGDILTEFIDALATRDIVPNLRTLVFLNFRRLKWNKMVVARVARYVFKAFQLVRAAEMFIPEGYNLP